MIGEKGGDRNSFKRFVEVLIFSASWDTPLSLSLIHPLGAEAFFKKKALRSRPAWMMILLVLASFPNENNACILILAPLPGLFSPH